MMKALHLSDFASYSKSFCIWRYISDLEHCRKMKFRIELHLILINKIQEYHDT